MSISSVIDQQLRKMYNLGFKRGFKHGKFVSHIGQAAIRPPWAVMTPEEYQHMNILGLHGVCRNWDATGNVAVWLLS